MTRPADKPYSRQEVVEIIQTVMHSVGGETDATRKMQQELKALSDFINGTRAELAQMRSIEISHTHIPSATDELDAIVGETAKATGSIMDACEKIEKASEALDDAPRNEITAAVTGIYEACTFQDITGQRITKVVKALKNIENKVDDILKAFGHANPATKNDAPVKKEDQTGLLNGPQLGGPAVSQADIDALLAGFDN